MYSIYADKDLKEIEIYGHRVYDGKDNLYNFGMYITEYKDNSHLWIIIEDKLNNTCCRLNIFKPEYIGGIENNSLKITKYNIDYIMDCLSNNYGNLDYVNSIWEELICYFNSFMEEEIESSNWDHIDNIPIPNYYELIKDNIKD